MKLKKAHKLFENSDILDTPENRELVLSSYGRVYVFNDIEHNKIKIGYSRRNAAKRIRHISTGSGAKHHEYYASALVVEPAVLEAAVHKKLKSFRLQGEWFNFNYAEAVNIVKEEISKLQTITMSCLRSNKRYQEERDQASSDGIEQLWTAMLHTKPQPQYIPFKDIDLRYVLLEYSLPSTSHNCLCVCSHEGKEYCGLVDLSDILKETLLDLSVRSYISVYADLLNGAVLIEVSMFGKMVLTPFVEYSVVDAILEGGLLATPRAKAIRHWFINNVGNVLESLSAA